MSARERFLIGGVGGLAPILMFLATGDFRRYLTTPFLLTAVGYGVRALILFFIGGFVVSLYREERQRIKIFQLGMGAPAMIAGFLAASSTTPSTVQATSAQPPHSIAFIQTVQAAQTVQTGNDLKRFTLPPSGAWSQFFEGLTGYKPNNVWFVIAGSYLSVEKARESAQQINARGSDFHADVYAPYGDNPNYAVVIGANLTQQQAKALRDKAAAGGLGKDVYYKTFPNLPLP